MDDRTFCAAPAPALIRLAWAEVSWARACMPSCANLIRFEAWSSDIEPRATARPMPLASCSMASEALIWFLFSVYSIWPVDWFRVGMKGATVSAVSCVLGADQPGLGVL